MQTQTMKLSGLTCPACKKLTEKRIAGINGINNVEVNVDSGIATINADREIMASEIKNVLKDTHYQVVE